MNALVGYTGFVGSNLYLPERFSGAFNSKNITEAYGMKPDLLIFAGLRAEKFLANQDPEKDMALVLEAENNIKKIGPKKLVLISTIDVFKTPSNIDETSPIDTKGLQPYGLNRYRLEQWVRQQFPDALIIRLPGLFGKNIKKNFIYDYINVIPAMLHKNKFLELSGKEPNLKAYYVPLENGFFRANIAETDREAVKDIFRKINFSALNFTDSRSRYQFYNLEHLWTDLQTALDAGLTLWHPATEPVSAAELYKYLSGEDFVNELSVQPADYDYRTIHAGLFSGTKGYITDKNQVMTEIRDFVSKYTTGRKRA